MSMNIGPMMRALLGDQPAEGGKALELRIGQIVRGVLLEMLDNQEALININGVNVRAKLDAEMPIGRGTLLQVQPNSADGLVSLKPLHDNSASMPDESLGNALKQFGLPEQKWAADLVRGLKRDGFPLGKDTAAFFQTANAAMPAGEDPQKWAAAADVAFRRGLQPTETTVASLRQALFGQPLHEALDGFRTAVAAWLGGSPETLPKDAAALNQRLQSLLSQGAALLSEGEASIAREEESMAPAVPRNNGEQAAAAVRGDTAGAKEAAGREGQGKPAPAQVAGAPLQAPASPEPELNGGISAEDDARATQEANARPGQGRAAEREASGTQANGKPAAPATEPNGGPAPAARPNQAADVARLTESADGKPQPSAPKADAAWIGRFLQWIGVDHEHQLLRDFDGKLYGGAASFGADPSAPAQTQETRAATADSLKSALLTLASRDDAPPALREAAQTLAAQVTGQQLLLATERNNNAPYSHMTLFVPMKGANGESTATIHVQSRRGRRGEWDTDNCRLLFDLRMKNLGDTVVDVQVVERIVSLRILNDFPAMQQLIDSARSELAEGMGEAGFQLLSLTTGALPSWKDASASAQSGTADNAIAAFAYASKPYKGVDFRA